MLELIDEKKARPLYIKMPFAIPHGGTSELSKNRKIVIARNEDSLSRGIEGKQSPFLLTQP